MTVASTAAILAPARVGVGKRDPWEGSGMGLVALESGCRDDELQLMDVVARMGEGTGELASFVLEVDVDVVAILRIPTGEDVATMECVLLRTVRDSDVPVLVLAEEVDNGSAVLGIIIVDGLD